MIDLNDTIKTLKNEEGFRAKPYQDHLGIWTIGYGFTSLTVEQCDYIISDKVQRIYEELLDLLPWLEDKPAVVIDALIQMAYQLGAQGLLGFRKTLMHIQDGNYYEASREALNSKWAEQTPARALRVSKMIESAG